MTEYARSKTAQGFDYEKAFHAQLASEGAKPSEYAGPDSPATHIRRYAADAVSHEAGAFHDGGIKVWSQAPWKGPGDDPRGFKHHDKDGVPIVTSRAEVDEVIARTREHATPLTWERDH